MTTEARNLC